MLVHTIVPATDDVDVILLRYVQEDNHILCISIKLSDINGFNSQLQYIFFNIFILYPC